MTVHTRRLDALSPADLAAWHDLAAHAVVPNAWLEPAFLTEIAAQWPGGTDLALTFDEDERGRWTAMLVWTPEPFAVRGRELTTASSHGSYLATFSPRAHPLVRHGEAHASLVRVIDALGREGLPGSLALDKIPSGPLRDALRTAARETGAVLIERPRGEMRCARANPDAEWHFGPPRDGAPGDDPLTRDFLRRFRRLSRGVGVTVETTDWADRPDVVQIFAELQSRGWKGDPERGGDGLALHPQRQAAFTRAMRRLHDEGRLRAITLHAQGDPLYMSMCVTSSEGRGFGIYDAYDERYARFGAGVIGRMATILAHTQGPDAVDFDPSIDPEVPQSAQLFDGDVPAHGLVIVRRGLSDRALARASVAASRLRHRAAR